MKRFDLVSYYNLAESLARGADALSTDQSNGFNLFFGLTDLPNKLDTIVADDNGLQASRLAT